MTCESKWVVCMEAIFSGDGASFKSDRPIYGEFRWRNTEVQGKPDPEKKSYSQDIRDGFSFERICINAETAEIVDFLNPKTSMLYAP